MKTNERKCKYGYTTPKAFVYNSQKNPKNYIPLNVILNECFITIKHHGFTSRKKFTQAGGSLQATADIVENEINHNRKTGARNIDARTLYKYNVINDFVNWAVTLPQTDFFRKEIHSIVKKGITHSQYCYLIKHSKQHSKNYDVSKMPINFKNVPLKKSVGILCAAANLFLKEKSKVDEMNYSELKQFKDKSNDFGNVGEKYEKLFVKILLSNQKHGSFGIYHHVIAQDRDNNLFMFFVDIKKWNQWVEQYKLKIDSCILINATVDKHILIYGINVPATKIKKVEILKNYGEKKSGTETEQEKSQKISKSIIESIEEIIKTDKNNKPIEHNPSNLFNFWTINKINPYYKKFSYS